MSNDLSAFVISNDGERAELELSNGERLHVMRRDPLGQIVSVEQFLADFPPGMSMGSSLRIERMHLN